MMLDKLMAYEYNLVIGSEQNQQATEQQKPETPRER